MKIEQVFIQADFQYDHDEVERYLEHMIKIDNIPRKNLKELLP